MFFFAHNATIMIPKGADSHAWQVVGLMWQGVCMVGGCKALRDVWQGVCGRYYEIKFNEQVVHMLLECILVIYILFIRF